MTLHLYWGSGSGPSWRALLALELKGLPYESHLLEFSKREQRSPEMLAMNPRGRVPVLRDGTYAVYESAAILAYLDRKFPEPPLFGRTPEETGLVWRHVSECLADFGPALDPVRRIVFAGKAAEQSAEVRTGMVRVHEEMARLDAGLGDAPWLAGSSITAADVMYLPLFGYLQRMAFRAGELATDLGLGPLGDRHPRLAAWWDRGRALPAFEKTFPPHWR